LTAAAVRFVEVAIGQAVLPPSAANTISANLCAPVTSGL
jgi:hypothetical protein